MYVNEYRLQFLQHSSFAAIKVRFSSQNYKVTEGDVVNVTLGTSTRDYEFDFNVTLQHISDGSATGESCSVICMLLIYWCLISSSI